MSKKATETEFQIRIENVDRKKIVDFTEKKLDRLSKTLESKSEREACIALKNMYMEGAVAVKWCQGAPRYVKIQK